MVRITVDLVRKRAEHHDKQLAPLEEIALHQESIEKIEFIQDWCPKLKILLLQSNLISKIENMHKLKYLEYLNLAINNVEKVENLERCESLQKLDLTINFIGDIFSIFNLVDNYNLKTLFLTGNPCTDYDGYRDFVIASLPQLNTLDGIDIERSERIKAFQSMTGLEDKLMKQQIKYLNSRHEQKVRLSEEIDRKWKTEISEEDEEERNHRFWQEKCEHAPEVRVEMERQKQIKQNLQSKSEKVETKKPRPLFAHDGRPFNINEPQITFQLNDGSYTKYVLTLDVYRHLNTSLLEVDIQPNYVKVLIKGKIFQMCLPEEIDVSNSSVTRSQITGQLVINLPKPQSILRTKKFHLKIDSTVQEDLKHEEKIYGNDQTRREYLEIGSSVPLSLNITNLPKTCKSKTKKVIEEKRPPADFVDNPDVPGLI